MCKQLLWLMYIDSRNVQNRKISERDLRSGDIFFNRPRREAATRAVTHVVTFHGPLRQAWSPL